MAARGPQNQFKKSRIQNRVLTAIRNSWAQTKAILNGVKNDTGMDEKAQTFLLDLTYFQFEALRAQLPGSTHTTAQQQDDFINSTLRQKINQARYAIYLRQRLLNALKGKAVEGVDVSRDINHVENVLPQPLTLEAVERLDLDGLNTDLQGGLGHYGVEFLPFDEYVRQNPISKNNKSKDPISLMFGPMFSLLEQVQKDPKQVQRDLPKIMPELVSGIIKGLLSLFLPQKAIQKYANKLSPFVSQFKSEIKTARQTNSADKGKGEADAARPEQARSFMPGFGMFRNLFGSILNPSNETQPDSKPPVRLG